MATTDFDIIDFDPYTPNDLLNLELEYSGSLVRDEKVLQLISVVKQYRYYIENDIPDISGIRDSIEDAFVSLVEDIEACVDGSKFDEIKELEDFGTEKPKKGKKGVYKILQEQVFEPMLRSAEFVKAEIAKL